MYEDEPPPLTPIERLQVVQDMLEIAIEELDDIPGGSRGRTAAIGRIREAIYWLGTGVAFEAAKPTH